MTVKPLGDRVLIKEKKAESKSASGLIHLPESAQEKTNTGEVIAVGDDKDVITVSVGQVVMFEKFSGTAVNLDGDDYRILSMSDLIAVIV